MPVFSSLCIRPDSKEYVLLITPEAGRLLGTAGGVALAVGMGARSGQRAAVDDQVLLADRPPVEPALEDLPRPGRVAGLGREAGSRGVGGHAVVGHRPPGVIAGGRLGEPD